jgi:hypothetical protein
MWVEGFILSCPNNSMPPENEQDTVRSESPEALQVSTHRLHFHFLDQNKPYRHPTFKGVERWKKIVPEREPEIFHEQPNNHHKPQSLHSFPLLDTHH